MPWIDDGTRYFRDIETRRRFMTACRKELEARGLAYVTISGDRDRRLEQAIAAIEARFPGLAADGGSN